MMKKIWKIYLNKIKCILYNEKDANLKTNILHDVEQIKHKNDEKIITFKYFFARPVGYIKKLENKRIYLEEKVWIAG